MNSVHLLYFVVGLSVGLIAGGSYVYVMCRVYQGAPKPTPMQSDATWARLLDKGRLHSTRPKLYMVKGLNQAVMPRDDVA